MAVHQLLNIHYFTIITYVAFFNAFELCQCATYDILVRRGGKKFKVENLPLKKDLPDPQNAQSLKFGLLFERRESTIGQRLKYAVNSGMSFLQTTYKSIGMLVTGKVSMDNMMGTVGITSEISQRVKSSWIDVWYFVACLSINLAVVNLLPIPGLDGGKLVFFAIEGIRCKPIKPEHEGAVQLVGMLLILCLFVFVTY